MLSSAATLGSPGHGRTRAAFRDRDAAARWLENDPRFKWFTHLTFSKQVTIAVAWNEFSKFARRLAGEVAREHLIVAWGADLQPVRGVPHFHLVAGPYDPRRPGDLVRPEQIVEGWGQRGDAQAVAYDPSRGGAHYLLAHAHWGVAVACPRTPHCRRRGRGCRVGGWQTWPTASEAFT